MAALLACASIRECPLASLRSRSNQASEPLGDRWVDSGDLQSGEIAAHAVREEAVVDPWLRIHFPADREGKVLAQAKACAALGESACEAAEPLTPRDAEADEQGDGPVRVARDANRRPDNVSAPNLGVDTPFRVIDPQTLTPSQRVL